MMYRNRKLFLTISQTKIHKKGLKLKIKWRKVPVFVTGRNRQMEKRGNSPERSLALPSYIFLFTHLIFSWGTEVSTLLYSGWGASQASLDIYLLDAVITINVVKMKNNVNLYSFCYCTSNGTAYVPVYYYLEGSLIREHTRGFSSWKRIYEDMMGNNWTCWKKPASL
jgi:hypothetical protein